MKQIIVIIGTIMVVVGIFAYALISVLNHATQQTNLVQQQLDKVTEQMAKEKEETNNLLIASQQELTSIKNKLEEIDEKAKRTEFEKLPAILSSEDGISSYTFRTKADDDFSFIVFIGYADSQVYMITPTVENGRDGIWVTYNLTFTSPIPLDKKQFICTTIAISKITGQVFVIDEGYSVSDI